MSAPDVYVSGAGEPVGRSAAGAPGRTSDQIRADIDRQRTELGRSVEALRGRSQPTRATLLRDPEREQAHRRRPGLEVRRRAHRRRVGYFPRDRARPIG